MTKEYLFDKLIMPADDFDSLLVHNRQDAYFVAAMTVVAFCNYKVDTSVCQAMINCLRNPADPMSEFQKQFLRDRLKGKEYKPYSFLKGSSPKNGYRPSEPFTVKVSSMQSTFANENWATLYLYSSGADNPRQIRLREKRSTHEWYLIEDFLLSDIREPETDDEGNPVDPWG